MAFAQEDFDIRCEWGEHGIRVLAPISDAVIIVDVLSFSTSVDIAVQNGASVYPFQWQDERAAEFAAFLNAELADPRRASGRYSLSPASLRHIPAGTRLVLPSLNGATLSLAAGPVPVFVGCLRNAKQVALAASRYGPKIAVIAAGERWKDDHSLRPCFEDFIGAGAIIQSLIGQRSPEAASAEAAFREVENRLGEDLSQCISGKELIERGYQEDIRLASELNASDTAPILNGKAFVRWRNE